MNKIKPTYQYNIKNSDSYIVQTQGKIVVYCEVINGTNRSSNYFWFIFLLLFGISFFIAGFSSYIFYSRNYNLFFDFSNILFIPQGILLLFYGTCSILLSLLIFAIIKWDIGSGTNFYDIENKVIRLTRKGFPKSINFLNYTQSSVYVVYPFSEINNIELQITTGLNPERICYIILKDNRSIPLSLSNQINDLSFLETRAIFIAKLLKVELKLKNS
jgi:hypothetical protein